MPENHCFYLTPRRSIKDGDSLWYTKNPVGHNTLGNVVKTLCSKGGIEGHHTNHSLRATTATRGLEAGIPEKCLMARTGHRSVDSLHQYQRESESMKVRVCEAIQNDKSMWQTDEAAGYDRDEKVEIEKKHQNETAEKEDGVEGSECARGNDREGMKMAYEKSKCCIVVNGGNVNFQF